MEEQNIMQKLDDLLGIVTDIKKNGMTREEGATKKGLEAFATKQDFDDLLAIITHVKDNAVTKEEFNVLDKKVDSIDTKVTELDQKTRGIQSSMVTKSYLDEKLADHRSDLNILLRKGDSKLKELVDILYDRDVIDEKDLKRMYEMQPFPAVSFPA